MRRKHLNSKALMYAMAHRADTKLLARSNGWRSVKVMAKKLDSGYRLAGRSRAAARFLSMHGATTSLTAIVQQGPEEAAKMRLQWHSLDYRTLEQRVISHYEVTH